MHCPKCGSPKVEKKQMLYERNTSFQGTQNPIGRRASPPSSFGLPWIFAVIFAGLAFVPYALINEGQEANLLFCSAFMFGGAILGAIVYYMSPIGKAHLSARERWENEWLCMACGQVFE